MSATIAAADPAAPALLRRIFSYRMLACLITGFSSGMPLYVLITLAPAYLRVYAIDIRFIGLLSLVMFPYTFKFLWAPFVDRYDLLRAGRRRSWMLVTQLLLIITIAMLGLQDPGENLTYISVVMFLIALVSATQDVTIDAYRRELLDDCELGLGNALFVNAYRAASLVPGSLSLILADFIAFRYVFIATALVLSGPLLFCLFIRERPVSNAPRTLREAVTLPFVEFLRRKGVSGALLCLLFVFLYKLGDSMATALATPFYIDLGYELHEIGIVAKNIGLASTIIGALLGGILMLRLGINRALWLFGLGQLLTILGFYYLALQQGQSPGVLALAVVICLESLGAGLGTAAFVAYIARECNRAYSATQFALLTSLSAVPRTFCNALTGYIVEELGWADFFIVCTVAAVPGLLLLLRLAPLRGEDAAGSAGGEEAMPPAEAAECGQAAADAGRPAAPAAAEPLPRDR